MKNLNIKNGDFKKFAFINYLKGALALTPMVKGMYDAMNEDEEQTGIFKGEHLTKGVAGTAGLTAGHLLGQLVTGGMAGGPSYIRQRLR